MRVLAVADETGVLRLIETACRQAGMGCTGVSSVAEGVSCLREWGPGYFAIALLDAAMLFLSGLEYCRLYCQLDPDLELIFLVRVEFPQELDLVFALGAEDFIVKPIDPGVLFARLKLARQRHERPHVVEKGVLRIDLVRHAVFVEGKRIDLTEMETSILLQLALQHGEPLSKADLLERIWHQRSEKGSNRVEVHMAGLRRKFRAAGFEIIRTVWGEGYLLVLQDESDSNGRAKQ